MSENQSEPKRKRGQRGPGKKTLAAMTPTPTPNPTPTPSLNPQSENDSNSEAIEEINIEGQTPRESTFGDIFRNAASKAGLYDDDDSKPIKASKKQKANQEEFNTLVIAVLTLVVSLSKIPQELKPLDSELGVLSNHLTGIMIRHLPIAKGMSADALDIIGIFAVISGYYARISPHIKKATPKQIETQPQPIPAGPADPINDISPAVGDFLKAAHAKAIQ
jgi:hypothetical protein